MPEHTNTWLDLGAWDWANGATPYVDPAESTQPIGQPYTTHLVCGARSWCATDLYKSISKQIDIVDGHDEV